jgi:hypothetical protein
MKLHEVSVKLTKGQILKILNDEPLEVTHKHLGHGTHVLHLKKNNLDKLRMGHKIKLSSDEKDNTIEGNGGFNKFFRNVGRTLKHALTPAHIESALIHQGIPIAASTVGSLLGGPAGGFAGSVAGHEIANVVGEKAGRGFSSVTKRGSIEAREKMANLRAMKGNGLFKALHKVGIHRKDVKHVAKHVGKVAAHIGIDALSTAANAYGVPVPEELREIAKNSADHLIDGNHHRAYETIAAPVRETAREVAREQVQHQLERLPPESQPFVQQQMNSFGFGLKHKHMRVIKGGNVKITRRPKRMHHSGEYIRAESQATFSPYANSNSPQMNPYQPTVNSFTHVVPLTGRGLYGPMGGNGLF